MVSPQLVEQWRFRLADWQRRLNEGLPRPWLAKAYVRVLSFLLKQYVPGDGAAQPPAARMADDAFAQRPSTMPLVVAAADVSGKPPRSRESIRSILEAVKAKAPHVDQGPFADGLPTDDPIVVAAFYHAGLAAGLEQELHAAEIKAQRRRFRRQTQVVIRAGDLERAKPIAATHAKFFRDTIRARRQYAAVFSACGARLGAVLGITVGAVAGWMADDVFVFFSASFGAALIVAPLFWLGGLVIGAIADEA